MVDYQHCSYEQQKKNAIISRSIQCKWDLLHPDEIMSSPCINWLLNYGYFIKVQQTSMPIGAPLILYEVILYDPPRTKRVFIGMSQDTMY
jgi:hypothetical protein